VIQYEQEKQECSHLFDKEANGEKIFLWKVASHETYVSN
jgi:hypothetical protein